MRSSNTSKYLMNFVWSLKSNISVGPPINLVLYEKDSLEIKNFLKLRLGDPYLAKIRKVWEECLKQGFNEIPDIDWQHRGSDFSEDVLID